MRTVIGYVFLVLIISAGIAGCKAKDDLAETPPPPPPPPTPVQVDSVEIPETVEPKTAIYYERTACFGTCPTFTFEALDNGMCFYEGRNFVDMIGKYKAEANTELFAEVFAIAEKLGYDTLQTTYDQPMVTDLPATITQIGDKRVNNRYQGPDLRELYNAIDSLIVKIDWSKDGSNQ
ncbi:DUF6438 domain-containing protein [Sanyastnella coralliicola]|uniref:DUF6438 domain-containing protein n=1 Tax=Sanyastnella coralliicola TaxID=3069118 RepID=UPI0027BA3300|nr:DUF6438 domain-containing protein [Longitalea sp. SCSIO 12813]